MTPPSSDAASFPSSLRWLLLTALYAATLWGVYWLARGFLVDDAFIVFRYVENLLQGHGAVYNPGDYVEGYSCPTWLFWLSGGAWLGLPVLPLAQYSGLAFVVWTALLVCHLAHRHLALPLSHAVLAGMLVVTSWPLVFWAGSGLETALFVCLTMGLLLATLRPQPLSAWTAGVPVILGVLLTATRPEGGLFAATLLLFAAWRHRHTGGSWRSILLAAAAFAFAVTGGLLARFLYYGDILPNTYYAKVGGGLSPVLRGLLYLGGYLWRGMGAPLGLLALLGLAAAYRQQRQMSRWEPTPLLGVCLVAGCGLFFVFAVGGDGLYSYRFVAHVVPALALLAATAVARFALLPRWAGVTLLALACLLGALPGATTSLLPGVPQGWSYRSEQRWDRIGRLLRHSLPATTTLATNVAGRLPYRATFPTLDLLGLTHKEIARTPAGAMGQGYAGHEKSNPAVVLREAPDLIYLSVLDPSPPQLFVRWRWLTAHLQKTPLGGYASLFKNPRFRQRYRPGFLLLPGPRGRASFAMLLVRQAYAKALGPQHPRLRTLPWSDKAK